MGAIVYGKDLNMGKTTDESPGARWAPITSTSEARILLIGLAMALLFSAALLVTLFQSPEKGQDYLAMTSINIMFGRAAGLSYGYAVKMGPALVLWINILVETILVLLVYPLFVFSWNHLLEVPFLKKFMNRIADAAEANREWVRKYGMIGLMLFVFIPFWMTGPVIGCIIGYFLNFKPWHNVAVVLFATYIAIYVWAVLLEGIHQRMAEYSPIGSFLLVAALILLALVGRYLRRKRK